MTVLFVTTTSTWGPSLDGPPMVTDSPPPLCEITIPPPMSMETSCRIRVLSLRSTKKPLESGSVWGSSGAGTISIEIDIGPPPPIMGNNPMGPARPFSRRPPTKAAAATSMITTAKMMYVLLFCMFAPWLLFDQHVGRVDGGACPSSYRDHQPFD